MPCRYQQTYRWFDLQRVDRSLSRRRFLAVGIAPPMSTDSPQRWADKYTVMCAGPVPAAVSSFFDRYQGPLSEAVRIFEARHDDFDKVGAWCPSYAEPLAMELGLVAVRNAGRWVQLWHANGAHADQEWVALLVGKKGRGLKTLYERRTRHLPHRCPTGDSQRGAWIDQFSESGWPTSLFAHDCDDRLASLWRGLRKLPAVQERCVRLKYSLFPAHQEWSEKRIGRYLHLTPQQVKRHIDQGLTELRKHFGVC